MEQYFAAAQVAEITRTAQKIRAGNKARAAGAAPSAPFVAPLEAATLTKKVGIHEDPFDAAQATRVA